MTSLVQNLKYQFLITCINFFFPIINSESFISVVNLFDMILFFLQTFRLIIYLEYTVESLILINTEVWPVNILPTLTNPYLRFWARSIPISQKLLPTSGIIALQIFLATLSTLFLEVLMKKARLLEVEIIQILYILGGEQNLSKMFKYN